MKVADDSQECGVRIEAVWYSILQRELGLVLLAFKMQVVTCARIDGRAAYGDGDSTLVTFEKSHRTQKSALNVVTRDVGVL